jgi:uncharacterized caspase-like protein
MHRHRLLAVFAALCFGIFAVPALADNRVALVIGNGAYAHVPHLANPSHDAEDVAASLRRTGFQTIVGIDLDQAGMQDAAIRFARAARTADVAMFYYSGHAFQFAGVNYMVPIDAELHDEADLRRMTRVDDVVADLQNAKNLRILVLDSCRDNPLADELKRSIGMTRSAGIGRGLAKIDSPEGMIVAYATQAGRTAEDGDGRNSPYTAAFLRNVEAKERDRHDLSPHQRRCLSDDPAKPASRAVAIADRRILPERQTANHRDPDGTACAGRSLCSRQRSLEERGSDQHNWCI